jgi:hypothetical protein
VEFGLKERRDEEMRQFRARFDRRFVKDHYFPGMGGYGGGPGMGGYGGGPGMGGYGGGPGMGGYGGGPGMGGYGGGPGMGGYGGGGPDMEGYSAPGSGGRGALVEAHPVVVCLVESFRNLSR